MKKFLLFVLFFAITGFTGLVQAQIPTAGLVGWYPLDGNANDLSGNNNHGTVIGATLTTNRFNQPDSAYYFNGNAQIDCGIAPSLNVDECTFSCWVYTSIVNINYQTLLAKYDVNNFGSFALSIYGDHINIWFTTSTNAVVQFNSAGTLAINQWYHITATHSVTGGTKLYINGIFDSQDPTQFNVLQAPNDHFRIGAQGPFFPVPLANGRIDDIRIYNIALDQADIFTLYNESECNQTIYDTITTQVSVYDTVTTLVTVYDTITTNVTIYDTVYVSVSDTLIIQALLTGVNPPNNTNTIRIYPNPTSSDIYIDYGNFASMSGYTLRIDNSLGQTVFSNTINQQQSLINLSGWSGVGTYFVYLLDGQQNILEVRKIVLQ
jgi:hypothetical protein